MEGAAHNSHRDSLTLALGMDVLGERSESGSGSGYHNCLSEMRSVKLDRLGQAEFFLTGARIRLLDPIFRVADIPLPSTDELPLRLLKPPMNVTLCPLLPPESEERAEEGAMRIE